ncbi:hypothetical protein A1F94_009674 [Pyrenophora tritici-repentis]|nr:hypothetical protein A1F99_116500 [Pyrenophora tritici-repentis]KAG9379318.1 hypothetical protein A1F94_009674 [Pyrenophora tritici-repentis]PZD25305.1 hypothetical protein A1F96_08578 [Pyrenophora tritici-repentis]PZD35896.1 hypothetical protein A1F97_08519 [Pyrenophora tritici-repentis]
MEGLRLRDNAADRTEKAATANHGGISLKEKLEPAFEVAKPHWAPQLRPDSQLPRSSSTRSTTTLGQEISENEAQPSTLVETPHVQESELRIVLPDLLTCKDTSIHSPSNTKSGEAENPKETPKNPETAIALASDAQNAAVAAACCALKTNGVDLTSGSPYKSSNARREDLIFFPPLIQATSPSCYAAMPSAKLAATTIFTPASTHSTSVEEPHLHHEMEMKYEQSSSEETIVPLPALGQTPRPGTYPSSIVVDGEVITFEPGKLGLRSPSDPPFICPWQRFPSSATEERCTRSQSPSCLMASHHNNAAGICHPLGAVGLEGHGTPCWCFECLKCHKPSYGVNISHSPPVQAAGMSHGSIVCTPEPSLVGESMDANSSPESRQSYIPKLNVPITENAAADFVIMDADISTFNLGGAVTDANTTVAPTTVTSAPASTTLVQRPGSPTLYDSVEPASDCSNIPQPISQVSLSASAKLLFNKPYPTVTESLPTKPSTSPQDIKTNVAVLPRTHIHSEHDHSSDYSIISLNASELSSWNLTCPVDFSSVDDDDEYDGSADEEIS